MATISQGINKIVTVKKQSGIGVAASGTGGQSLRRETSTSNIKKDTYENNEIATHQQGTGKTHGLRSVDVSLNGILSPGTYSTIIGSALRKDFVAITPIASVALTIAAGTPPAYTVTRSTGSFLTDDIKIGDVVRLSVGTLHANNISKNLLVLGVSATILTVVTVNGSAMEAEGPITGCTVTVVGKKSWVPLTGHTRDYWTLEEWQSDITESELFTDVMIGGVDVNLPSTGNATLAFTGAGLNGSTSGSQVLTTPTAETTTNPLAAINGLLVVNGAIVAYVNSASIKIDGKVANMGAVIGSNVSPDIQRGRIDVSGSFTAFYQDGVLPALFDAATLINLIFVVTDSSGAAADFVTFSMGAVTLDGASKDDGEKGIVRTYPFHARINSAGGTDLANDRTIISVQDSQA